MSTQTNKPVQKFKDGAVTMALYENQHENRVWHNITIGKLYKDDQGRWQESRNFNEHDLLKLQNMIPQAYAHIQHRQQQQRTQPHAPQQDDVAHMAKQERHAQDMQNMQAARDAALSQAAPTPQHTAERIQDHAPTPPREPQR